MPAINNINPKWQRSLKIVNTVLYGLLTMDCLGNKCMIYLNTIHFHLPIFGIPLYINPLGTLIIIRFLLFNYHIFGTQFFLESEEARLTTITQNQQNQNLIADNEPVAVILTRARMHVDINNMWVKQQVIAMWLLCVEIITLLVVWFNPSIAYPVILPAILVSFYYENIV